MRALTAVFVALTIATVAVSGNGLGAVQSLVAPEAPGELILHESLFQKITKAMLPLIIETARKVSIPGTSSKHFSYGTITLSEFNINNFVIGFAAPNKIVISLRDLSMAIPHISFEVKEKWHFIHIHCSGKFWASVGDTNIALDVGLGKSPVGGMSLTGVTDSVSFGKLSVGHRFNHEACRIAGHIVEALIGDINHKIEEMVRSKLGPMIAKAAQASLSKAVEKLPIKLISAPVATSNSITFSVDVLSLLHSRAASTSDALVAPRAIGGALPARDVAVGITAGSANILLGYASQLGYFTHTARTHYTTSFFKTLLPAAYALCPDCKMQLPWKLESPQMSFNNAATFSVTNAEVTIDAISAAGKVIPILTLQGNITGFAANFTTTGAAHNVLHFVLGVPTLHFAFIRSAVGMINAEVLNKIADFAVRDVVIPSVNAIVGTKGIPAPTMSGLVPADVAVQFTHGFAYFGLNIDV